MVASADGLQEGLDSDLQAATNTSLPAGQQDGRLPGGVVGAGGMPLPSNLTSSTTMDTAVHLNVTADVTTADHVVVTSPADAVTSDLPPGGADVASTLPPSSPSTYGKEKTVSVRAPAAHPTTALPATTVRSPPLVLSAPPPAAPTDPPAIADKLLSHKSPTQIRSNIITGNTTIASRTILPNLSHQGKAHQQNQTQFNQDPNKIETKSSQERPHSGPHMSVAGTGADGSGGPAAPPGHQGDATPPSSVNHLIIGVTFLPTHRPSAAPPVGDSKTNVHSADVLKSASGKSRTPFNETDVVTLARSGEPEPGGSGGLPVAAVVVPLVCVLLLLVIGLIVFLHRRRTHTHGYKHRTHRDEESCTDVTSSLMSPDPNGVDNQPTSEPVYAIVDKSKKRRATESLSGADESVSLTTIGDPVYTANGTCTSPAGAHSTQGVAQHSPPTPLPQEEFSMVPEGDDEPLYDVPPQEGGEGDSSTGCEGRSTPQVPAHGEGEVLAAGGGVEEAAGGPTQGAGEDLTLVECDVYEAADHYHPSRDDGDGTYEIPDSPATVRARRSVAMISGLLQDRGYLPADTSPACHPRTSPLAGHTFTPTFGDETLSIPQRIDDGNTSDSSSGLDSDFEDLWAMAGTSPSLSGNVCNPNVQTATTNKAEDEDEVVRTPPPVPRLPPESEGDSDYYLSPTCHPHCPPGPGWKPFHEYDPVYVPHSDPSAMAARVDSQNYVRGRQRSDSRTNPYEEIQFGAIYDTVDDDDDVFQPGQLPLNPIQVPPRVPIPPSPPPPLVPRRVRPISGVADVGGRPRSMNKPLPDKPHPDKPLPDTPLADKPLPDTPLPDKPLPDTPLPDKPLPDTPLAAPEEVLLPGVVLLQQQQEPRYSGLIMEDVPHLQEEDQQHDYTPLEYTKLHSVGSRPLLDDDDIKAMDETDSETYSKEAFSRLQQHEQGQVPERPQQQQGQQQQQEKVEQQKPPLPPTLMPTNNTNSNNDNDVTNKAANGSSDYKSGLVFRNGDVINSNRGDPYSESSSDSDDSYEPFDFSPPEPPASK